VPAGEGKGSERGGSERGWPCQWRRRPSEAADIHSVSDGRDGTLGAIHKSTAASNLTGYRLTGFIPRNRCHGSAVEVGKATVDFLGPRGLRVRVEWLIQALDQRRSQVGAIPLGQTKSRIEDFLNRGAHASILVPLPVLDNRALAIESRVSTRYTTSPLTRPERLDELEDSPFSLHPSPFTPSPFTPSPFIRSPPTSASPSSPGRLTPDSVRPCRRRRACGASRRGCRRGRPGPSFPSYPA
jgi:hypothetical protein